ncbi:globin domain-containing protein [Acidithiobacillus ferridurans]|uniref:globin domain-containing protein n=2 Tax=Acidithiobacillus TaxID=119977 RepID=UPI001C06E880|nr:globin domain-containing protein [Acidithiobacillus ferridurans]MBU2731309.1 globin [Acidithiobacillus ferridurans]
MAINIQLIQSSGAAVKDLGVQVAEHFYNYMFTHFPEVRKMFPGDMTEQRVRLFNSVILIATNIDTMEVLVPYLKELGVGHIKYDTRPEHYPIVGKSLLNTLKHFLGAAWTQEMAESWIEAYNLASTVCIEAAYEAMAPSRFVPVTIDDVPPAV